MAFLLAAILTSARAKIYSFGMLVHCLSTMWVAIEEFKLSYNPRYIW